MKKLWAIAMGLVVSFLFTQEAGWANETLINFDDPFPSPPGGAPEKLATLDVQYGQLGVVFEGAPVPGVFYTPWPAHSTHSGSFEVNGPQFAREDGIQKPMRIRFRSLQKVVRFFGATGCASATGILTAFDAFDQPLPNPESDETRTVDVHVFNGEYNWTEFSVVTPTPQIGSIQFDTPSIVNSSCVEVMDDLYFEGDPVPGASGEAPAVRIVSPVDGEESDSLTTPLAVTGTVSGTDLAPYIRITLTALDTEGGTPRSIEDVLLPLPVTSGSGLSFATNLALSGLAIGHYSLTATVWDSSGRVGSATAAFLNQPAGHPLSNFGRGKLLYAVPETGCHMLFFQNGAILYQPQSANVALALPIPMATAKKWATASSPSLGGNGRLGCYVETAAPCHWNETLPGMTITDFERGRIYENLQTGTAIFVPGVLRDAICTVAHSRGFAEEAAQVGLPVADPTYDLAGEDPTWAFQRYAPNKFGQHYLNTVEVRGHSPRIYIERIGGDIREFERAEVVSLAAGDDVVDEHTPTIWTSYACSPGIGGSFPTKCDLSRMPHPKANGNILDDVEGLDSGVACGNEKQAAPSSGPQWSAYGQTRQQNLKKIPWMNVKYSGIIKKYDLETLNAPGSHLAYGDSPFIHDNCHVPGSLIAEALICPLCAAFVPDGNLKFWEYWFSDGNFCRSDWNLHTRPLLPAETLVNPPVGFGPIENWNLLSARNVFHGDLEIEFEAKWAEKYFNQFLPRSGDLVSVMGHHIVDCGHKNDHGFFNEIHPPSVSIVSRSIVGEACGGPISAPCRVLRATDVYIWINSFFGIDGPTSVDLFSVYPPPRPSATSRLKLMKNDILYTKSKNVVVSTREENGGIVIHAANDPVRLTKSGPASRLSCDEPLPGLNNNGCTGFSCPTTCTGGSCATACVGVSCPQTCIGFDCPMPKMETSNSVVMANCDGQWHYPKDDLRPEYNDHWQMYWEERR